jgi:hypothetical protein
MDMPEQHDEPPRRQPGPLTLCSRCPRLTILGHNHRVQFEDDPKLGPKATIYGPIGPETGHHNRAPTMRLSAAVRQWSFTHHMTIRTPTTMQYQGASIFMDEGSMNRALRC